MVTEAEELQAKEFLKRAEIITMKKDLRSLREADALGERDKIAQIKTIEEQKAEEESRLHLKQVAEEASKKAGMQEVLESNENQEKIIEEDLKNYASEEERQKIFLLEGERLSFEKQIDEIDKEKDPQLKIEKNNLLLQKRDQQEKLNSILEQEKKLEGEQGFIIEKSRATTIATERSSLEQRRWDLDKEIQEIEKKRWAIEKQIEAIDAKAKETDKFSEQFVTQKNLLRDKIFGINKSLRTIYSVIIAREEDKRTGKTKEELARREALSKSKFEQKEKVQRQQWAHTVPSLQQKAAELKVPVKHNLKASFKIEEDQRKKFLDDVEQMATTGKTINTNINRNIDTKNGPKTN